MSSQELSLPELPPDVAKLIVNWLPMDIFLRVTLINKECKDLFWSYREEINLGRPTRLRSVWLDGLSGRFSQAFNPLKSLRRFSWIGASNEDVDEFLFYLLPQLSSFEYRVSEMRVESTLKVIATRGTHLRSLKLRLPHLPFLPVFQEIANTFKNLDCLHLLVEPSPTDYLPLRDEKWRGFVAALPKSLRELFLNVNLFDLGSLHDFHSLSRLHVCLDVDEARELYSPGLPQITPETSAETRKRMVDHFVSIVSKFKAVIPGELVLNTQYAGAYEGVTPWGMEMETYLSTLLEIAVCQYWIPVEVLQWIHKEFPTLEWDALLPHRTEDQATKTVVEDAFRYISGEKLLWILKNVRPNLLRYPHRLPVFLNYVAFDLPNRREMVHLCVGELLGELLDESLASMGMTRDQLGCFFTNGGQHEAPTNLLMQTRLTSLLPFLIEAPDLLHRLHIDINARHPATGETALHRAAVSNISVDLVEGLLQLGADPYIKDGKDRTCIQRCIEQGAVRLIPVFFRHNSTLVNLMPRSRDSMSSEDRKRMAHGLADLATKGDVNDALTLFPFVYLKDILDDLVAATFHANAASVLKGLNFITASWTDLNGVCPPNETIDVDSTFRALKTHFRLSDISPPPRDIENFVETFPPKIQSLLDQSKK